jgi:antitoxin ParD1/3/4
VAEGRYNNVSEVVRAALRVLQEQEAARAAFIRSLEDSAEEGERDEFVAADAVERNVRAAIDEARPRRA